MKKGIIVLLITVLAAGMAFAGVTGKAAAQFTFNLDEGKGYGFGDANPQSMEYSFKFEVDSSTKEIVDHQTDIWAEIGVTAHAQIEAKKASKTGDLTAKIDKLEISKANIHINSLTIDILGPSVFFDYASSFTTTKYAGLYTVSKYDMTSDDLLFGTEIGAGGVNVLYDGYTVAFAFNRSTAAAKAATGEATASNKVEPKWFKDDTAAAKAGYDTTYKTPAGYGAYYYVLDDSVEALDATILYVGAETKAYELAECASVQVAGNFMLNRDNAAEENVFAVSGSAMAGYEADKLAADIAIDGRLDIAADESKAFAMDVLANAKYDIVNGAVYFGSDNLGKDGAKYIIEAKVGVDVPVSEEIVLSVAGEVDDFNVALKENALKAASYKASVGTTVDKLTVGAEFGWNVGVNFDKKGNPTKKGMKIAANASYALEVATIKGSISVNFLQNADGEPAFYAVRPAVSIESASLIENCKLSLGWEKASLESDDFAALKTATNGKIVAAATIEF